MYVPNDYWLIVKWLGGSEFGLNSQIWNAFPVGEKNNSKKICVVK
jgi:hypothetical protein